MSGHFFNLLESINLTADEPDKIRSFLRNLEDQFDATKFTDTEWKFIHEKLVEKVIPALKVHITSKQNQKDNILKDWLELLRKHVIFDGIFLNKQLSDYLSLAITAFNQGSLNSIRVNGLELLQTLFSQRGLRELNREDTETLANFVKSGLLGTLTKTTPPSPSLILIINSTLGHLCK